MVVDCNSVCCECGYKNCMILALMLTVHGEMTVVVVMMVLTTVVTVAVMMSFIVGGVACISLVMIMVMNTLLIMIPMKLLVAVVVFEAAMTGIVFVSVNFVWHLWRYALLVTKTMVTVL